MKKRIAMMLLAAFAAAGMAGCGEKPQTTHYEGGSYRGKPDTRPWDNAPGGYGSPEWSKGNQLSWENGIRDRMRTQNEYSRIGH